MKSTRLVIGLDYGTTYTGKSQPKTLQLRWTDDMRRFILRDIW